MKQINDQAVEKWAKGREDVLLAYDDGYEVGIGEDFDYANSIEFLEHRFKRNKYDFKKLADEMETTPDSLFENLLEFADSGNGMADLDELVKDCYNGTWGDEL